MSPTSMLHDDSQYLSQLRALSLWAQQRFEPTHCKDAKINQRKKHDKEATTLRSKVFLFGCLGHLRVLNALVDGALLKALVFSYFVNHYLDTPTALSIFKFIRSRFANLTYLKQEPGHYNRGRWIFRVIRCLHQHKGTPETLTLIFICICRFYGISARLVEAIHGACNNVVLFAEVFEVDSGSWKRANFNDGTYDGVEYPATKCSRPLNKQDMVTYTPESSYSEHNGKLYVQRENKFFIYKKGAKMSVIAIVVARKDLEYKATLNVLNFPFEEEQFRLRLMSDTKKGSNVTTAKDYTYVLGCNKMGWLSELTPKYVERYNDICLKRGKSVHDWLIESVDDFNQFLKHDSKTALISLLEKADAKWIERKVNNDPLPVHKSKFKNHPIYVLDSQIGNNRIKKKDASPIGFFKGEEVYLRCDLEELKTRGAWLKLNRRVIENAKPVTMRNMYNKTTMMRVPTAVFSEGQTVLMPAPHTQDGEIPTTEYDNVDTTGQKFIPVNTVYLRSRKPDLLFKAARLLKIYHKKAFSSYQKEDRFKPEIDGIVIRKPDWPLLIKKYEELATRSVQESFERTKDSYRNFWRSVFKTMLAEPPIVTQEHHRKIRKELDNHVSKFLNRIEHLQ